MKTKNKRNHSNQTGITLIALVVTIVVLLILAGVSINAIFSENGIIKRAKDAQNKMDQATQNDLDSINELNNWIDGKINGTTGGGTTGGDANPSTTPKISTLVGKVVDKNTKAEDAYGNKITIPKGFKILEHNPTSSTGAVTYNYTNSEETGEHIPAVQDGIVIENGTDGNQFVWVPVGTIKNKNNTTNTITLGRYEFDSNTGALKSNTPAQVASVENCTQEVVISNSCKELSVFRAGNTATDSTAQNATARNLKEFISTTLSNGGYYIARFEASGTASKITSKYNQKVLVDITQPNAAKLAREMYEEVKENNELVYASDLVNSYAWDTAIVFIQTYSVKTDYASHNESNTTKAFTATGKNNDKYCNIFDMSGNASEWTTEYSTDSYIINSPPCVIRGGCYNPANGSGYYTSSRSGSNPTSSYSNTGLRPLLYVK
ncbi:MAG: SUMF1/EgtB/PvdO family nonheme iron enzyme [Clostridia bacterium]